MNFLNVFRFGNAAADAFKSQNRAALGVALGGLLVTLAPLLGGIVHAHPDLAALLDPDFLRGVGGFIATVAGLFYHFGTSPDRGLLPAKPEPAPDTSSELNRADDGRAGG